MKMTDQSLCCDRCFHILAQKSPSAAKMWLDLCDIQFHTKRLVGLINFDLTSLRLLEILGFIITSETHELVIVNVKTNISEDNQYFCGGKCA